MASLKNCFNKPPGAWTAASLYDDATGGYYLQGGRWENPDTSRPMGSGQSVILARLGRGQVLGITQGGVYAVDPPAP